MPVGLSLWGGQIIIVDVVVVVIVTARPVHVLASMQQTAFSFSQKPLYHLVFLCISSPHFKGAVEDYVFSCIISLLPKCLCWRSAGRARLIYRTEGFFYFCLSLKQYEHSLHGDERSHLLNMGRSPHFELCVCLCVCVRGCVRACACECFTMFSVIG